ncbi:MAG: glycosyltransferase family 61 protein [Cyanobacteriota bacterium]|nr:glycosyltransferase family 61 protein [Cyanobacteriota bacterium]
MAKTFALSPAQPCTYGDRLRNLWNLPLQRLATYCQPFERPGGYFKVSPQASCNGADWIGLERTWTVIEETLPFRLLKRREYAHLLWSHFRAPIQDIQQTACVLIDHLNRNANFFHWFLDALPRIFAAEAYEYISGTPCYLVVPATLQPWQWDSLKFLGMQAERIIQIQDGTPLQGYRFDNLVSTFSHRHIRHSPTGHFDALSPDAIHKLSERMAQGAGIPTAVETKVKRLYISRGTAGKRRVLNEDLIMDLLSAYGFQRVCPDKLCLADQIHLFRGASHVIAPHGGALTNLLHVSPGCQVLEVFQSSHGLRPDFFQLAALKGATYSFCTAETLNASHDIEISAHVLHSFLEASL